MAEEFKVVTQTYDLVMWLLPQVSKFPRDYRFVLGDRIINGAGAAGRDSRGPERRPRTKKRLAGEEGLR